MFVILLQSRMSVDETGRSGLTEGFAIAAIVLERIRMELGCVRSVRRGWEWDVSYVRHVERTRLHTQLSLSFPISEVSRKAP